MLRRVEPRDLPCLAAIRSDLALQHLLLANPDPGLAAAPDVGGWIARREAGGWFRVVVAGRTDEAAGFVQISQVHRKNRHGWMGIALLPGVRGKGIGRQAIGDVQAAAVAELGLRKLLIEVRADNVAAIRLYQTLGFRIVGTLRHHYDDGLQVHDVVICEWLADSR